MTSGCLDRKEVRGAIWGVHSTTDRPAGGNTGRLFLTFGGPVCADWFSNCPLDRVLTYKNLIYLLNLQFSCVANIHVGTQMIHSFPQNTCSLSSVTLEGWSLVIKLNVFVFVFSLFFNMCHVSSVSLECQADTCDIICR